jgi:hypothetical protein
MFFDDRNDVCQLLSDHGILAVRILRADATADLDADESQ